MSPRLSLALSLFGGVTATMITAFVACVGLLQIESRTLAERHATVANSLTAVVSDVNALFETMAALDSEACASAQLATALARHPYAAAGFITNDQGRLICHAGDLPHQGNSSKQHRSSGASFTLGRTTFIVGDGSDSDARRTLLVSHRGRYHVLVAAPVLPLLLSAVDAVWLGGTDGKLLHARHELDDRLISAVAAAARSGMAADALETAHRVYVRSDRVPDTPFALQSVLPLDEWLGRVLQSVLAIALVIGALTGMLTWSACKR